MKRSYWLVCLLALAAAFVPTSLYASTILPVFGGGTGTSTFGQGWLYSSGGTNGLAASTSPTVNYITATSTTATSTYANGIALSGGCFALPNGTCLSTSGAGSVTSITAGNGLSGGTITTSGTISLNLGNSNWWTALQNFSSATTSSLTATSSQVFLTGLTAGTGNGALCLSSAGLVEYSSGANCVANGSTLGYTAWGGTIATNYGITTIASTTPAWFQQGFYASSTSQLAYATSTLLTISSPNIYSSPSGGEWLINTTSATSSGTPQYSPVLDLEGTDWGSIGGSAVTSDWYLQNQTGASSGGTIDSLMFSKADGSSHAFTNIAELTSGGAFQSASNNTNSLGTSANVWNALYVTNASTTQLTSGSVGVGSTTPTVAVSLGSNEAITTTEASTTYAATIYDNWFTSPQTKIVMTGNITIHEQNDTLPGMTHRLILCQDGTGSRTVTWGSASSSLIFSGGTTPTQTSTANACDVYSFITTGATGTVVTFGAATQNFP